MGRTCLLACCLFALLVTGACGKTEHPANDPSSAVTPGGPDAGMDTSAAGAADTGK